MKITNSVRPFAPILFALLVSVAVTGCSNLNLGGNKNASNTTPTMTRETTAVYYDFKDVLIPKELKVLDGSTVVVSTPGYTSGIISLKGRIESRSLFNFFSNNMIKDNWNMISNIKSPASTIMIFQKESRWAVITIREKDFNTYVEVGVAPTIGKVEKAPESNLFN
ncbi:putative lipoprotein [Desulforapulum autotrophicum HRM2]|uniref:Lipoprotein n=1 Tax=Desulforapulum autotrophicum (strain ATCC 43914 / DSM 3382 / VKM B-1955 / HRM2) TaxID=177437 RepID=C0QJ41_DESAH|nr:hypothetical protein [Desulforapulum autotrophicum]ACN15854.1 putative lipoprotein [Desulforapulum autotrophicum HRM2]